MNHDQRQNSRPRRLGKAQTPAESRPWHELRNRRFTGCKFRRQHPVGLFVADFHCHEARPIIELDGESHFGRDEHDRRRQDWVESRGLKVLRSYNNDIPANLDEMLECIFRECRERCPVVIAAPLTPGPSPGGRGEADMATSIRVGHCRESLAGSIS